MKVIKFKNFIPKLLSIKSGYWTTKIETQSFESLNDEMNHFASSIYNNNGRIINIETLSYGVDGMSYNGNFFDLTMINNSSYNANNSETIYYLKLWYEIDFNINSDNINIKIKKE